MENKWIEKEPTYGDHIRVMRDFYSHHGIFVDNETVIQFGGGISGNLAEDIKNARVLIGTFEEFKKGGKVEVRIFDDEEKKKKRKREEVVKYAFSCVGKDGYDLINNNCEHFANECIFGERKSEQVEKIEKLLSLIFKEAK